MKAAAVFALCALLAAPSLAAARTADPVLMRPSAVTECLWQGTPQADREAMLRDAREIGGQKAVARFKFDPDAISGLADHCAPGAPIHLAVELLVSEHMRRAYMEELRVRFGVSEERLKAAWSALPQADRNFILHLPDEETDAESGRVLAMVDGLCAALGAAAPGSRMAMLGWLGSVGQISASVDAIKAAQSEQKR